MDERTGQIFPHADLMRELREGKMSTEESEHYREIPAGELPAVEAMNRKQRRAWAAQKRSEQRARFARARGVVRG